MTSPASGHPEERPPNPAFLMAAIGAVLIVAELVCMETARAINHAFTCQGYLPVTACVTGRMSSVIAGTFVAFFMALTGVIIAIYYAAALGHHSRLEHRVAVLTIGITFFAAVLVGAVIVGPTHQAGGWQVPLLADLFLVILGPTSLIAVVALECRNDSPRRYRRLKNRKRA